MGGVVQAFTRPTTDPRLAVEGDYGNADAPHLALFGATPIGERAAVSLSADVYRSDGYRLVSSAFAGPVDLPAPFESQNVGAKGSWSTGWGELWAVANYFREERSAGTAITENRQWTADAATGLRARVGAGELDLQLFGGAQRFHNSNSRVDAARASEVPALTQQIPVGHLGGSALWSVKPVDRQTLTIGVDSRYVDATNLEQVFDATGAPIGERSAAGRQLIAGVFGEWSAQPVEALTVSAGLRADGWWNFDGRAVAISGASTGFEDRRDLALSPRVTAILRAGPRLAFRAAGYTGFRAPNLNELYRGYFSGGVQITPNPELGAERLLGGELGTDWDVAPGARLAVTAFANQTSDRIEQTTIDERTRQRRNIAEAQAAGAELQLRVRLLQRLRLSGGYALTLSRISRFPERPELEGRQLPNTPVHAGTATLQWTNPALFDATVRVRAESRAFADERNAFQLPGFAAVDLTVSRRMWDHAELYASVANAFDAEIVTDRNETIERVGAPRAVWAGFRVEY
jgi:iron complex outermembrane receptor protein